MPLPTKKLLPQQEAPRKALVTVQPPRREDLQPSYASTMAAYPDDNAVHGWYESMVNTFGGCLGTLGSIPGCICCPNPYKRDKYISLCSVMSDVLSEKRGQVFMLAGSEGSVSLIARVPLVV